MSQWGVRLRSINLFSTPPLELATNFVGTKDAQLKMQSFYAIQKVANSKGVIEKNDTPSFEHQNCCHTPKIALTINVHAYFKGS